MQNMMSGADPAGVVFENDGLITRVISNEAKAESIALVRSEMFSNLVSGGFFPATKIISETPLTLSHETIHPFALPGEWSYEMLRAAAIAILEINKMAYHHGYELIDPHPYNVTFVGTKPVYFDFGSFRKMKDRRGGWSGLDKFNRTILYPLLIAQKHPWLLSALLDRGMEREISDAEFRLSYSNRMVALALTKSAPVANYVRRNAEQWDTSNSTRSVKHRLFDLLHRNGAFAFPPHKMTALQKRIKRLPAVGAEAGWGDYQSEFTTKDQLLAYPRFARLSEIIASLKPESIIDLAGNMGAFSLSLAYRKICNNILCVDYDAMAVDQAYQAFAGDAPNCGTALVNFMENPRSIRVPATNVRMQQDTVVALALTHHLLLTQGVNPDVMMERISSFGKRFAVIEFMPLGLYDGTTSQPMPNWYTLEWFRDLFSRHFEVTHEEQLEPNRIVFVGRIKP